MGFEAEALRFERDAAAAGEGIEQGRRLALGGDLNQPARLRP